MRFWWLEKKKRFVLLCVCVCVCVCVSARVCVHVWENN